MRELMILVWVLALSMTLGSVAFATEDEASGSPKPINEVSSLYGEESESSFFETDEQVEEEVTDGSTPVVP